MDGIRRLHGNTTDTSLDWQTLIHPASAYGHPREVLADPDLTTSEKRAILSSWASDACAVPETPGLRQPPGAARPVSFDDIIGALRSLDDGPPPRAPAARAHGCRAGTATAARAATAGFARRREWGVLRSGRRF